MLTQRILESQKFVNLVTRRNLALIAFSDVVSDYSGNNSEVRLSENLFSSLKALSTDGISIVFITGGTHETFSRFTDMPGFVSLDNYGLSLCDKTGVHFLKQAQPYRETMGELFDRLSLWLPTSIDIENRGVSIALNYGGVLDHGKAII